MNNLKVEEKFKLSPVISMTFFPINISLQFNIFSN